MWNNPDFRKMWWANAVSSLGSQITRLALPLTAVLVLHATPLEMGLLAACATFPYLVAGLPAGAWIDRHARRPILIGCDVGRAVILLMIPLLALGGWLALIHLYGIAILTGLLSLLFDLAEEAYLPAIVDRSELVEGNSQLAAIDAASELAAPVVAGGLVQWLSAPLAVALDAATFLWSALWLSRIQVRETRPTSLPSEGLWVQIRVGLEYVIRSSVLRPISLTVLQWQLFGGITDALLILYLSETLGLPPAAVGLVYAVGSLSALVGSRFSPTLTRKWGVGPLAITAAVMVGTGWLIVPFAAGTGWVAFACVAAGLLVAGLGNLLWNVTTASLVQATTPTGLLGRVNATGRVLTWGALPIGSLLGGWLGEVFGVRAAMVVAGVGVFSGAWWVWRSSLRQSLGPFSPGGMPDDSRPDA